MTTLLRPASARSATPFRFRKQTGQLLGPRETQEDRYFVGREGDPVTSAWVAVVDGMGGHAAGEVAAQITCDVVRDGARLPGATPAALLAAAHRAVRKAATGEQHGMGAAAVVVHIHDDRIDVAWLGDCRASVVERDGTFRRLTIDQTIRGALERKGKDGTGYDNTMLLGSVGMPLERNEALPIETATCALGPVRRLLCTTDGVHDVLSDGELAAVSKDGAQAVLDAVTEHKERDNATIVILGR